MATTHIALLATCLILSTFIACKKDDYCKDVRHTIAPNSNNLVQDEHFFTASTQKYILLHTANSGDNNLYYAAYEGESSEQYFEVIVNPDGSIYQPTTQPTANIKHTIGKTSTNGTLQWSKSLAFYPNPLTALTQASGQYKNSLAVCGSESNKGRVVLLNTTGTTQLDYKLTKTDTTILIRKLAWIENTTNGFRAVAVGYLTPTGSNFSYGYAFICRIENNQLSIEKQYLGTDGYYSDVLLTNNRLYISGGNPVLAVFDLQLNKLTSMGESTDQYTRLATNGTSIFLAGTRPSDDGLRQEAQIRAYSIANNSKIWDRYLFDQNYWSYGLLVAAVGNKVFMVGGFAMSKLYDPTCGEEYAYPRGYACLSRVDATTGDLFSDNIYLFGDEADQSMFHTITAVGNTLYTGGYTNYTEEEQGSKGWLLRLDANDF